MKNVRVFLLALVVFGATGACGQDVQDRPTGGYTGTFRPPPGTGGGGGDEDAGAGDAGVITGRNVEGRVVAVEDLSENPERAAGVPERQVGGLDTTGTLVTTVSGADGAFLLESLSRADPIVLSVSGDPPSYVVLPASEASGAIAPVIELELLQEIALTQAVDLGAVAGHAVVWLVDRRGDPVPDLTVEVVSAAPVLGPYYGTLDPTQLSPDAPTGSQGVVVFLNAVPGDLVVNVFRAADPTTTETLTVPIADGVVTFVRVETAL